MYKMVFFVPKAHCEKVKKAIFETGAGMQGDYQDCAWQVLGQGQFMPLKNSTPFIGKPGQLEYVEEYRVELLCEIDNVQMAIDALKHEHPYEEPAYEIYRLEAY